MPLTDPWLGLSPPDQFVALPEAGRLLPVSQSSEHKRLVPAISVPCGIKR